MAGGGKGWCDSKQGDCSRPRTQPDLAAPVRDTSPAFSFLRGGKWELLKGEGSLLRRVRASRREGEAFRVGWGVWRRDGNLGKEMQRRGGGFREGLSERMGASKGDGTTVMWAGAQ